MVPRHAQARAFGNPDKPCRIELNRLGEEVLDGLVDALLEDLIGAGNARYMAARNSVIVQYNEIALSRWVDKTISGAGIRVLTGAVACCRAL